MTTVHGSPEPCESATLTLDSDAHTRIFEENRELLFGVVYRLVGSVADTEDLVHDTYLRWRGVDLAAVHSPREYLISVATRLAIDYLRSARVRRDVRGPVAARAHRRGTSRRRRSSAELAESLQTAFMLLLERLTPTQRAAYLLFEVFGLGHGEVARILDTSVDNSRQLVSRARVRLREGRARFESSPDRIAEVTRRFLEICEGRGGVESFLEILAEDVVFVGDGGGKVPSLPKPIHGAERVAQVVAGFISRTPAEVTMAMEWVSGQPAIVAYRGGAPFGVLTLAVSGDRIRMITVVLNPEKLRTFTDPQDTTES